MSLFGSLTTAIGGMNAQQDWIGNISDNIANSQTVGFKTIDTGFQNLVTESNAEFNNPGGVLSNPIYENALQGTVVQSSTNTSLALSGNGYFVVAPPPAISSNDLQSTFSGENLYTRRGDFVINNQGYLVNGAGYYLQGFTVNPTTGVTNTSTVNPIQISQLTDQAAGTANVNLAANLSSTAPTATGYLESATATPPDPNPGYITSTYPSGETAPSPVTEDIYDSQGNPHQITLQFNKVDTAPNTWTVDVSVAGDANSTTPPTQYTLTFNSDGTLASLQNNYPPTASPGSVLNANATTGIASGTGTKATIDQTLLFTAAGTGTQSLAINFGDFGEPNQGLTQSNATTTAPIQTNTLNQDGYTAGSFQSVSIDANGYVKIAYTNGQTVPYFQVPVATVPSPDQMQRLDGGAYQATIASGNPVNGIAGQNGAASIDPSALEQSTVDIAGQFTQLITAQQAYTANAKVITTANQLLTTVVNLVQG